jgi:hypothetical protein
MMGEKERKRTSRTKPTHVLAAPSRAKRFATIFEE